MGEKFPRFLQEIVAHIHTENNPVKLQLPNKQVHWSSWDLSAFLLKLKSITYLNEEKVILCHLLG